MTEKQDLFWDGRYWFLLLFFFCLVVVFVFSDFRTQIVDCQENLKELKVLSEQQPQRECVEWGERYCEGELKPMADECFEGGEEFQFDIAVDYNVDVIEEVNIPLTVKVSCPLVCDGTWMQDCLCWSDELCAEAGE